MSGLFGRRIRIVDDTALPPGARLHPADYAAWVEGQLSHLGPEDDSILRLRRPRPTAAFSPQDAAHAAHGEVKALARARGFEPVARGTGGRLTMFDGHALGLTILAPHADPRQHTMERYRVLSGAIAAALVTLGIDARVGELPGEYCPGKFSINAGGRIKLVGVAQRMNNRCLQMGAVIAVNRSEAALAAITEAYGVMGLPFDPATYGAVSDLRPDLAAEDVAAAVLTSVSAALSPA